MFLSSLLRISLVKTLGFFHADMDKLWRILIYVMLVFLSGILAALVCVRVVGGK